MDGEVAPIFPALCSERKRARAAREAQVARWGVWRRVPDGTAREHRSDLLRDWQESPPCRGTTESLGTIIGSKGKQTALTTFLQSENRQEDPVHEKTGLKMSFI